MTPGGERPSFAIARRERILDDLHRHGAVRVADLARDLGVSELTVRRDLGLLADRGLLTRVHGGATLRSRLDTTVPRASAAAPPRFRLGVVVPSLRYYWPHVLAGAQTAATAAGVQLVLRAADYAAREQQRQIASLLAAGDVHALVVAPETEGPEGRSLLRWLDGLPIPVVLAERQVPAGLLLTRLEVVATDHAFGAELAAAHLEQAGHTRVGVVGAAASPTTTHLRSGWERAAAQRGTVTTVDVDLDLEPLDASARAAAVTGLLDRCRATSTTALFVHPDLTAVLLQQGAVEQGWRVPEDLAIVAYDDEVAGSAEPAVTAVRPPKGDVGRIAVLMIVARLQGGPGHAVHRQRLLPTLIARTSTMTR